MNNKIAWSLLVLVTIATIIASGACYQARKGLRDERSDELAMMLRLLREDQALSFELRRSDGNILASYLAAIRADGVAKNSDTKVKLDRIAENDGGILALINVYMPRAKTTLFSGEADRFRRYAFAWRDRWNSVMELYMAGGNYPVAEVPFPKEFLGAVQVEMEASQHAF